MKRLFKKIHIWLSLPFGIIITIACFTGAMLVFETELQELGSPSHYFVKETKAQPLPLSELIPMVNRQLDTLSIANVSVHKDTDRTYAMGFPGRGHGTVYVDPYTGEIVGNTIGEVSFFAKVRQLHRWLLDDSRKIGRPLVGISTLIMVFILITGAIIWIPRRWEHLLRSLKIRTSNGWKRFFYDLHVAGGLYASVILLTLALTGLTWSFEWYRDGVYKLFGVETPAQGGGHQQARQRNQHGGQKGQQSGSKEINYAHWDKVLADMRQNYTDYGTIRIQDESVSVGLVRTIGNIRASDQYTFDAKSGEIKESKFYADSEKSSKMRGWLYTVHVGAWGGMFTRVCTLIAALIGTALPITGYYFYFARRRKLKKAKP